MAAIKPINETLQVQVVDMTRYYIERATQLYGRVFAEIPVSFALTGRAAGMYHVQRNKRYIRYNPYIFAKYFDDNLHNTVPHEVAHYVADVLHGIKNIRPHGREWKAIMREFGVEAKIRCDYSLEDIPQRRHRLFTYQCQCREYQVTTRRHNMICRGERYYKCPACHTRLDFSEA